MTALSPSTYLTASDTTEGNFQTGIGNLQAFVTELLGGASADAQTVSSASITPVKAFVVVDGSGGSTNLSNIIATNHPDGRLIILTIANNARAIVLKNAATGSGQIYLGGNADVTLDVTTKMVILRRSATGDCWNEVSRNWGVGPVQTADIASIWTALGIDGRWCGTSTNSGNAYTVTASPVPTALVAGQTYRFIVNAANTGAATLNVSALGAKSITKSGTTALASGDMPINSVATVVYDGTQYQLQDVAGTLSGGTLTSALNEAQGSDIASAGTINLTTATGNVVDVTGTTTITAITLAQGAERWVRFTGALTLTNGASLVLLGGANITTAAGDFACFRGYGSSVVRMEAFFRAGSLPGFTGDINTWSKPQVAGSSALTSSSAADFTLGGNKKTVTVNGGTFTLTNPSAATTGALYQINISYTTSNAVAWGTNFKGISALTFTNTAGAVDKVSFEYNGSTFELVGYSLNAGA